jgi:hypothetical protein
MAGSSELLDRSHFNQAVNNDFVHHTNVNSFVCPAISLNDKVVGLVIISHHLLPGANATICLLELVGAAWHVSYLQKLYQRECRFVCTLA